MGGQFICCQNRERRFNLTGVRRRRLVKPAVEQGDLHRKSHGAKPVGGKGGAAARPVIEQHDRHVIARDGLVRLLDQVGAGQFKNAVFHRPAPGGVIRHIEQQPAAMRLDKRTDVAGFDPVERDPPFVEERPCCRRAVCITGEDAARLMLAVMPVKLPCLCAALEDGKGAVISGRLQCAGPDDRTGAPGTMEKGGAARRLERLHIRQQQAVGKALRAGNGELPVFGRRADIEQQGIAMVLQIFGRCHFRKAASVGEDLTKRLGPDILALHKAFAKAAWVAGRAVCDIGVSEL